MKQTYGIWPNMGQITDGQGAEGAIRLSGLQDGPHHLQVFDAQGRLVLQRQVRSTARRTDPIPFSGQGTALYVAVVDGQRAGRFIPIR